MPRKYSVRLQPEEREQLESLLSTGSAASRTLTYARILLKADQGEQGPSWKNEAIADAFEVSTLTVTRVRKRFLSGGLAAALHRKQQERRKERRLDGVQEAQLIALVCGDRPEGRERWSLRLLAQKMVELGHVEGLSYETVRRTLKKGTSSLG